MSDVMATCPCKEHAGRKRAVEHIYECPSCHIDCGGSARYNAHVYKCDPPKRIALADWRTYVSDSEAPATMEYAPFVPDGTKTSPNAMDGGATLSVDSTTGGMKGAKTAQMHLIPASILLQLADHYGKGELKYASDADGTPNFSKGYKWSLSYDALQRHMLQFWSGEDLDAETGTKHVIAALWHCIFLALMMDSHPELDDRWEHE